MSGSTKGERRGGKAGLKFAALTARQLLSNYEKQHMFKTFQSGARN